MPRLRPPPLIPNFRQRNIRARDFGVYSAVLALITDNQADSGLFPLPELLLFSGIKVRREGLILCGCE
jgi:hypothetical protein